MSKMSNSKLFYSFYSLSSVNTLFKMTVQQYRFSLDSNRPTKLFHCPQCRKREFKRYVDNHTGEYLPEQVGCCNRINNCGYHYTPKQYFMDNPTENTLEIRNLIYKAFPASNIIQDSFSTIPLSIFEKSLKHFERNNFVSYLKSLFYDDLAMQLVERFKIGTSKHWEGSTVFWQIDILGNIRAGKIMLYDGFTGKRQKDNTGKKYINWAHSSLKLPQYNLQQCLFGEHQLKYETEEKTIAIVESEKTAILMTALIPECVWLATGGLHNLKVERYKILAKRKVILFPDLNAFDKWKAKEDELQTIGCQVATSCLLECNATTDDKAEGYDLADYFIKRDPQVGWVMHTEGYPLFWNNFSLISNPI